ncbi:hypothetical protein Tco_0132143 [Tanacetum coccineum]
MNVTSSKTDERIDKLADQLSTLVEIVSKKVVTPAPVKAVEESCVTCGGAHSWYNCPATDNNQASVCATTAKIPLNENCSAMLLKKLPEKLGDPDKFLIPCNFPGIDGIKFQKRAGIEVDHAKGRCYPKSLPHPTTVKGVRSFLGHAGFYRRFIQDFSKIARPMTHLLEKETPFVFSKDCIDAFQTLKKKLTTEALIYEPFSGSTTNHSDGLPPSSSPVKTSENPEEFSDELTLLKKVVHVENFQVYSNPLFEFDDDFTSSNVNPLFNEMDEDVENKVSNVLDSDEPVLLNTPLSDKVECFAPEDNIDEIDAFLAMEFSSNFEEGYFDSEGGVIFLENLLSDDTTHNLTPEVTFDHEPKQNESSITFSPRSDPLHHEFAGELLTLPSRNDREFEDYLSRMTLLCEISISRSQENVHANPSSIIESLPVSLIPIEDSELVQEEIDIFLVPDDLIPPGVENDDSEDEDIELPNLDHQDNPSSPRPLPEPPNVCLNFEPDTTMKNDEDFNQGEIVLSINVKDVNSFTFVIWTFLPFFTYPEDSPFILSLRSEDLVFDTGISTFHFSLKTVPFALPKDE